MSMFIEEMIARAHACQQTIVMAEGEDARILAAARQVVDRGIANVIVLGSPDVIASHGIPLDGIRTIDPATSSDRAELAHELARLRARKGLTSEQAYELLGNELYYGTMLVKVGRAGGMVAGACHTTAQVLRPSMQIVKMAPGTTRASSAFVMIASDRTLGSRGRFLFADCATNEEPDSQALASIALSSADTFRVLIGDEPRVAMLSFSTHGSAEGGPVDKVRRAVEIARSQASELALDGDLQLDAAIVPEVAAIKAPESPVAGRANVLVFPSLEAGNIGYKLVERFAKAEAYGPISQGTTSPISDLSRGCSVADIVGVVAITAIQAHARQNEA